ncbi:MAG: DUF6600 domain-containing protein [Burkholderiaceae bacterium]
MKASSGVSRVWRRVLVLVVLALIAAASLSLGALAQTTATGDPSGRVARLSHLEGAVSFSPADGGEWTPAVLNRPLTRGDRLWVTAGARAELHAGSTALRLNGPSSLDLAMLDDQRAQFTLRQGTLSLRVRSLLQDERFEINTPNLALVLTQPGEYRLDVDPQRNLTRISVQSGAGTVHGQGGESLGFGGRQQLAFTGTDLTQLATQEPQDGFDRWVAERNRREDQSVSAQYVSRDTLGYQQLDDHGDWRTDPGYGPIWVPRITVADWAPYRWGHWTWIAPWGWTWIDDAPWGFAPFHYGRWAHIGARWCWVPGPIVARPVFVPALVVFVGAHHTHGHFKLGAGHPGVAWFPLAPGEHWRPAFRASPGFIAHANKAVTHHAAHAGHGFRHQHMASAVTAVPADAFVHGQPLRDHARRVDPAELARAQVVAPPPPGVQHRAFPSMARPPLSAAHAPRSLEPAHGVAPALTLPRAVPQPPQMAPLAQPPAQAAVRAQPARVQGQRDLPAFTVRPDIAPRQVDGALPGRPQPQAQPPLTREHQGPSLHRDQAHRAQGPQMHMRPPQMHAPPRQMQAPPPQMHVLPPQVHVRPAQAQHPAASPEHRDRARSHEDLRQRHGGGGHQHRGRD